MLEELKTFIAVVEYKNFTRAGEYLKLSQPSVSTHIKNLERSFGVTLINRSVKQKTIFITENGYKLYQYKGYEYYKENPSLAAWEAIEKILTDCNLI